MKIRESKHLCERTRALFKDKKAELMSQNMISKMGERTEYQTHHTELFPALGLTFTGIVTPSRFSTAVLAN